MLLCGQKPTLDKARTADDTGVSGTTSALAPLSALDGDDGYVAVASNNSDGCGDDDVDSTDNEGEGCDENLLKEGGVEGEEGGAGAGVSSGGDNGRITTAVVAASLGHNKVLMEM